VASGIDGTLRLSLREGSAYYFEERTLSSAEPHYFVVVNADPLKQEVLILSIVTSKVAETKLRRKDVPETLVELSPVDFDVLKKPSIIDCNSLKSVSLIEFNERFIRKRIRYFDKDLPVPLRAALRAAIHRSRSVSAEVKALINP